MKYMHRIFAFDVGTASLGIAVREGKEIKAAYSYTLPEDFASIAEQRQRRRQYRTRLAHKARENWLKKQCREVGIEVLQERVPGNPHENKPPIPGDPRLEREFPAKGDNTVYTSCFLRIRLLRGEKLEGWQVYKALRSAIQRRGYDPKVPWKNDSKRGNSRNDEDEAENLNAISTYQKELTELVNGNDNFMYPCYYDACKIGVWDPSTDKFRLRIDNHAKRARGKGLTPPRSLVEKEVRELLEKASEQFPKLTGKIDYVLYGPAGKPYASYNPTLRNKYGLREGGEKDWEGVLSQKVPRFDNRIVENCCLIPRYNVCRANDPLVMEVTFLLKLMNMRFFGPELAERGLTVEDVQSLYAEKRAHAHKKRRELKKKTGNSKLSSTDIDKITSCYKLTEAQWGKWLTKCKSGITAPNHKKIDPPSASGRSRYCRPALRIMRDLILSGKSPHEFYDEKLSACTNTNPKKGLVADDFAFLLDMPYEWEAIHVPQRSLVEQYGRGSDDREEAIKNLIASHKNPIVRHRLSLFKQKLQDLTTEFGKPDHVVMEFIREDFMGEKAKKRLRDFQEARKKERDRAREKMEEADISGRRNLLTLQLHEQQNGICLYTGESLGLDEINELEIDHAVPRRGRYNGSDAIVNKVLTHSRTNRDKGDRTPYEYLTARREWQAFCERVSKKAKILGRKKVALLTAENPEEMDEKYTSLAETAWIARNARSIACLIYGWQPGKKAERRRVSVINGGLTARVRRKYKIDSLLAPEESDPDKIMGKKRDDDRHHALDAMVLSYIPDWARNQDLEKHLALPEGIHREYFAKKINSVMAIPAAIQKPGLEEMIYAKRQQEGHPIAVRREPLLELGGVEKKFSPKKAAGNAEHILDANIRKQVLKFLEDEPDWEEWQAFVTSLTQSPRGGASVNKVALFQGEINEYGDLSKDQGCVRGHYRRGKQHQGQFVYKDVRGSYRVRPVYVYESRKAVEEELLHQGFDVFGFFFSNCVIEIEKPVEVSKGTIPAGKYVMSSLWTDRRAKLKGTSELLKNPVSLQKLADAGMHRVKE